MGKDDFSSQPPRGAVNPRLLERQRMRRERLGSRRLLSDDAIKAAVLRAETKLLGTKPVAGGPGELEWGKPSYPNALTLEEQRRMLRIFMERQPGRIEESIEEERKKLLMEPIGYRKSFRIPCEESSQFHGEAGPYVDKKGYTGVVLEIDAEKGTINKDTMSIDVYLDPMFEFWDGKGDTWSSNGLQGQENPDPLYRRALDALPGHIRSQKFFLGFRIYDMEGKIRLDEMGVLKKGDH